MFDCAPSPSNDHALMQDRSFAAALRLCGQNPVMLDGGLTLLHRRLLGLPVAMLPRAAPPQDLRAQMRAAGLRLTPLILSPEALCRIPRALRLRAPLSFAEIDLTAPEAARCAALHGKWRNQLRAAENSPLRVSDTPLSPDDPLIARDAAQARARGYANWPPGLTAAFATVAPDQTRVFVAYDRGHPVAQMLFLLHGRRATYHIGYSTREGRSLNAHNLILWRAGCWLSARGFARLDLGMIDPRTPTLNRFKLRAGAAEKQTAGTFLNLG